MRRLVAMKALVTGATGYIGGRLVPRLLERGIEVRCSTRDPMRLQLDPWREDVEVVAADALAGDSLDRALDGCDVAFYLVHSMANSSKHFAEMDRRAASNFSAAADRAGLQRVIYLGALGNDDEDLSSHLRSRHEVGRILAAGSTPVTEFRAAVIIGSGSVSFEMVRHLTELLPVMFRPKWTQTRCQPIAVRNVLEILVSALDDSSGDDHIYEIGGPDVVTYEEMTQIYAEEARLRPRVIVPLPLFSSTLAPRTIALVTPLVAETVRPLVESMYHDVVVSGEPPPGIDPSTMFSYRESVERALWRIAEWNVETRWTDAVTRPASPLPSDPHWSGAKMQIDHREVRTSASADDLFWAFSRIGGDVGYYTMNWAWRARGWFDSLIGGVGLRRGRRHPEDLRPGEALDFFRVAEVYPQTHRLTLQAEMKVPGVAWLGWRVDEAEDANTLVQTAGFVPRGLFGRLYWWTLLPFHAPIFRRMANRIVASAKRRERLQRT